MNLRNFDLNLFIAFDAIYTESSLSGAARRLCITQPAVSSKLARLRHDFKDPLFVRSGRRMVPTPVAQNAIQSVRAALALLRASDRHLDTFDARSSDRTFTICMGGIAETLLLPALIRTLRSTAPNIRLNSWQLGSAELARELLAGRLNCAINALLPVHAQLHCQQIIKDRYVCLLRRDHPMAQQPLSLADYLKLGHVLYSARQEGLGFVDNALKRLGHERSIVVRSQAYLSARELIRTTDLAITLPSCAAQLFDVAVMELPFTMPPLELLLYWHDSTHDDPASRWLRNVLLRLDLSGR